MPATNSRAEPGQPVGAGRSCRGGAWGLRVGLGVGALLAVLYGLGAVGCRPVGEGEGYTAHEEASEPTTESMAVEPNEVVPSSMRPASGENDVGPKRKGYVTQDEAREAAAHFMGVGPDEVVPSSIRPVFQGSDLGPPLYRFALASDPTRLTPHLTVNAATGEVTCLDYEAERHRRGTMDVGREEARAIALAYVEEHWARFGTAAVLLKEHLSRTPPEWGLPPAYTSVPSWQFRWVVREGDIEVGFAEVHVNATTGKLFFYGQGYYTAQGLEAARVSAEEAVRRGHQALPARSRNAYTPDGTPVLRTRWFKGQPRLVWMVTFKETGRLFRDIPPRGLQGFAEIEAVTGEVVSSGLPK